MLPTWTTRGAWVLLLALALWAFLYRLGAAPLLDDPNEGEYAEVAREMVETGDWLTPQLNYVIFLNKPPLTYWAIGAAYLSFGVNEFAARLPSALAGVVIVLLVAHLGTQLYDAQTGLLAGFVLLASGGFFVETHEVRPDLLLTAGIVGSLTALAHLLSTPRRASRGALLGLQVALAVGLLAKGMVAALVPGLVFLVMVVSTRRVELIRRLLHPSGWWLFAILMIPWHVVMSVAHPGFLWDYVVNQHVLFFFDRKFPRDSVPVSLPVFWAAFALRLSPWTVFAPLALVQAVRGTRRGEHIFGDRFVLAWAGAVLLFFSAASSRMEHYSIPALPALALLVARLFRDYGRADGFGSRRLLTAHVVAFAALALVGSVVVPQIVAAQPWLAPVHEFPPLARTTFGVLAAGAGLAAAAALLRRRAWVAPALVAAFAVAVPFFVHGLTLLARVDSSAGMAAALRVLVEPGEGLVYEAPIEYQNCAGFNFYLRRKLDLLRPAGFVAPTYLQADAGRLFMERDELERMWQETRVFLITDPLQERPSPAGVAPQPVYIVVRDNVRWAVSNRPVH